MVLKSISLFLLGAVIASGEYAEMQKSAPYGIAITASSNGCPLAPAIAPLICQFMQQQQNMQLHYKPQLITPSTYIPPIIVEKCETPQSQMEIEIPLVGEKVIVIPQRPVLPTITIPKFPIPVKIELPNPRPIFIEPREPAFIPEKPVVSIPVAPELPPRELPVLPQMIEKPEPCFTKVIESEVNYKPMVVPPPQLPAFVMPELPKMPPMIVPSFPEEEPIAVAPIPEYIQPLPPVPAAPELPPARLPELPIHVEIPPLQPVLPPMHILPPPLIFERPAEVPCITGESIIAPQPPKLSEFIIPEPVKETINKPVPMPIFPIYSKPAYIADPCETLQKMDAIPPYFVRNIRPHNGYKLVKEYVIPHMATYGHKQTGYLELS